MFKFLRKWWGWEESKPQLERIPAEKPKAKVIEFDPRIISTVRVVATPVKRISPFKPINKHLSRIKLPEE